MTHPYVRTTVMCEVVDSTNDLARQMLSDGRAELPLLVRAERQTAGRGRGGNKWWSDEGSLTFTLAIDPIAHGLRVEHEPRLALATAVAIIEAIEAVALPTVPLGIRWPNDVEAGGRKLAGILPEIFETGAGRRMLIGVGLNVTTRLDEAPEDVRTLATTVDALRSPGQPEVGMHRLLDAIVARLQTTIDELARDDRTLAARWAGRDTLRAEPIRVDLGDRIVEGIGAGIDERGALRLVGDGGTTTLYGGRVLRR